MKIGRAHAAESGAGRDWLVELEQALDGRLHDPEARSWQELREDVRALAPPLDPELERRLHERIVEQGRHRGRLGLPSPIAHWLHPRLLLAPAGGLAVVLALAVAVIVLAPWDSGEGGSVLNAAAARSPLGAKTPLRSCAHGGCDLGGTESKSASHGPAATLAPSSDFAAEGPAPPRESAASSNAVAAPRLSAGAATPAREQEVAASITLGPEPQSVQKTSERAGRIAVQDGGYVERSNVTVEHAGTSEATLSLAVPSSKLGLALGAIAKLAPVDGESQSLEDITNPYESARRRLADARAEHQALLKALSEASTEEQIERLRERLSRSSEAISRDSAALNALAHRADTAEVEVSIVGRAKVVVHHHHPKAGSAGLTIDRGLHDAGHVLTVALAVLLIAAAVLLPLALVVLSVTAAWRAWRRYQREQVLQAP